MIQIVKKHIASVLLCSLALSAAPAYAVSIKVQPLAQEAAIEVANKKRKVQIDLVKAGHDVGLCFIAAAIAIYKFTGSKNTTVDALAPWVAVYAAVYKSADGGLKGYSTIKKSTQELEKINKELADNIQSEVKAA